MAIIQAQTITHAIDPTEGFISYVNEVKPYHTKILEVLVEYVHEEAISSTITEEIAITLL